MLYPSKFRLVNADNNPHSGTSWYEVTFSDFPSINASHADLFMALSIAKAILKRVASDIPTIPIPSKPNHGDIMIALEVDSDADIPSFRCAIDRGVVK